MIARRLLTLFLASAILAACSDRNQTPVPKPVAYARVSDYDSCYTAVVGIPIYIEANCRAVVNHTGRLWFDVSYPDYGATIFYTITPTTPDSIDNVLQNRQERISLNISDPINTTTTRLLSPDFSSILVYSPLTRTTPLQFLASDESRWVVSGAVFFSDVRPDAPTDSLEPMIETIRRDLTHSLSNLTLSDK